MKAPFAAGEPVMCVKGFRHWLVTGRIYIVKKIWQDRERMPSGRIGIGLGVSVHGVPDEVPEAPGAEGWAIDKFRPLNPDDYEALRLKHGIPVTVKTE